MSFLRESLSGFGSRFRRGELFTFFQAFYSNISVKQLYDTAGLFDELQGLERQFQQLPKDDLITFYQSLLKKISDYAENPGAENTLMHKKTLAYLYTATLSKLDDLKTDDDSSLIMDVRGYLRLGDRNINALANLQEKSQTADIVNAEKKKFQENIDAKIKESNHFITAEISPFIDHTLVQIDAKIDLLINETLSLQRAAEVKKDEFLKKIESNGKSILFAEFFQC